jgi:hypothetical protein
LITRKGIVFTALEAVVAVAKNGSESPLVIVERARGGETTQLIMTVGMLAILTRGAKLRRGNGAPINWAQAERRCQTKMPAISVYRPIAYSRIGIARVRGDGVADKDLVV